jgi:hypothetical protein
VLFRHAIPHDIQFAVKADRAVLLEDRRDARVVHHDVGVFPVEHEKHVVVAPFFRCDFPAAPLLHPIRGPREPIQSINLTYLR